MSSRQLYDFHEEEVDDDDDNDFADEPQIDFPQKGGINRPGESKEVPQIVLDEKPPTKSQPENYWKIERNRDGRITEAKTLDTDSPVLKDETLAKSRLQVLEKIETGFAELPEQKKLLLQSIKSFENRLKSAPENEQFQKFPCLIASRYTHLASLIEAGFPASLLTAELEKPLTNAVRIFDRSGKYDENLKEHKFEESDDHIHYKPATSSPRAAAESFRKPELWEGKLSESKEPQKLVLTFSKDGARVESWEFSKKSPTAKDWSLRPLEAPDPSPDKEGLSQAREKLFNSIAGSGMSADAQIEMLRDLTQLEHRARLGELGKSLPETRLELAKAYKEIERLLSDQNPDIPKIHKLTVARQLARELGDPSSIDQGVSSDACRMVSAQYRLACKKPSAVAKVVCDALLEGKVRFGNKGEELALHSSNRQPSSAQALKFPRPENERSFACQLFQLASMNALGQNPDVVKEHLHFMREWKAENADYEVADFEKLKFVQTAEQRNSELPSRQKNGMLVYGIDKQGKEQLVAGGRRVDGATQLLLQAYSSQRVLDLFDPGNHKDAVVAYRGMHKYTKEAVPNSNARATLQTFESEDELKTIVLQAKTSGNLPLIIASRDYSVGPGQSKENLEEELKFLDSNHSKVIRDYVPAHTDAQGRKVPEHFVCDDFFGNSYDRKILPRSEWSNYFMNKAFKK
ncbi:MAG: hypothetical protein K2X27_09500 [Candidatus Obscuribacterales bacterium]|nr:hypothetical protein [Candidatus Obscuribacterales bacterium]